MPRQKTSKRSISISSKRMTGTKRPSRKAKGRTAADVAAKFVQDEMRIARKNAGKVARTAKQALSRRLSTTARSKSGARAQAH